MCVNGCIHRLVKYHGLMMAWIFVLTTTLFLFLIYVDTYNVGNPTETNL